MIDFKEEILKYKPLIEIDDVEESIKLDEITDVMEILRQMIKHMKNEA